MSFFANKNIVQNMYHLQNALFNVRPLRRHFIPFCFKSWYNFFSFVDVSQLLFQWCLPKLVQKYTIHTHKYSQQLLTMLWQCETESTFLIWRWWFMIIFPGCNDAHTPLQTLVPHCKRSPVMPGHLSAPVEVDLCLISTCFCAFMWYVS